MPHILILVLINPDKDTGSGTQRLCFYPRQLILIGVVHPGQRESLGRSSDAPLGSVSQIEYLPRPAHFPVTPPDRYQYTSNISDHVM